MQFNSKKSQIMENLGLCKIESDMPNSTSPLTDHKEQTNSISRKDLDAGETRTFNVVNQEEYHLNRCIDGYSLEMFASIEDFLDQQGLFLSSPCNRNESTNLISSEFEKFRLHPRRKEDPTESSLLQRITMSSLIQRRIKLLDCAQIN